MGFNKFTWIDRDAEYLDRRTITDTSTGLSQLVTITRNEGTVFEQGTAFSSENMNSLENRIDEMFPVSIQNIKTEEIIDLIYPIGSIYMSVNSTSPSVLFGGSWEQIQDRFLLAAGSTYSAGTTGGSETHTHVTQNHTLTTDEIPSHSHNFNNADDGSSTYLWSYQNGYRGSSKISTDTTGGGQPHNHGDTGQASNLPPYLSVYMWQRTA